MAETVLESPENADSHAACVPSTGLDPLEWTRAKADLRYGKSVTVNVQDSGSNLETSDNGRDCE